VATIGFATVIEPVVVAVSVSEKTAPLEGPLIVVGTDIVKYTSPLELAVTLAELVRKRALDVPSVPLDEEALKVVVEMVAAAAWLTAPLPPALRVMEPAVAVRLAFTAIEPSTPDTSEMGFVLLVVIAFETVILPPLAVSTKL
jgi:hypothetical protein